MAAPVSHSQSDPTHAVHSHSNHEHTSNCAHSMGFFKQTACEICAKPFLQGMNKNASIGPCCKNSITPQKTSNLPFLQELLEKTAGK